MQRTTNKPNLLRRYIWLPLLSLTLLPTACQNEDDIADIFIGRTWYIVGATINGQQYDGNEIKELYAQADSYHLTFAVNSFSGILVAGSSLNGQWTADGKHHTLTLQVKNANNVEASTVSRNIYNVLRNVTSYSGDVNNLIIQQDSQNFIRLYHTRQ